MSRSEVRAEREKSWLAILLAWVAGVVDAVGFLTLVRLFTANMSGNSDAMGVYIGLGQWSDAAFRATPIPLFVLGVMLGAALTQILERGGVRSTFAVVLGLEAALLVVFVFYAGTLLRGGIIQTSSPWQFVLVVALLSVPMGIQTAALRRVGKVTVHTTYVTGMLTSFAEQVVNYLFWLRDHTRGRTWRRRARALRLSTRQLPLARTTLLAGIWLMYAGGAVCGSLAEQRWSLDALALPVGALVVVVAFDLLWPIGGPTRRASAVRGGQGSGGA